ncbi:MAG: hypothetical protein V1792_19860, partial [Pseudomonadota bacterium]
MFSRSEALPGNANREAPPPLWTEPGKTYPAERGEAGATKEVGFAVVPGFSSVPASLPGGGSDPKSTGTEAGAT